MRELKKINDIWVLFHEVQEEYPFLTLRLKDRHFVRSKKIRELLAELKDYDYHFDKEQFLKTKVKIELAEFTDGTQLYLLNDEPYFLRLKIALIPTLQVVIQKQVELPEVVVDEGAIKFIVNGADIMAPGILKDHLDETILKRSIVQIVDENYHRPIAIGQLIEDTSTIKKTNKGKVVKNLHHIGDKLYNSVEMVQEKLKS